METTFCNHLVNKEMALIGAFPEYCISNINGSISVLNVGKSRTSAVLPRFECYLPPGVRHHAARAQAGQAGRVRRGAAEPRGSHHRHQEVSRGRFLWLFLHSMFVSRLPVRGSARACSPSPRPTSACSRMSAPTPWVTSTPRWTVRCVCEH